DQHRADRRRGLRTAAFVSGYRGSPLAGLDTAIERAGAILREHDIVFSNGLNEELAATAIFGSQMAHLFPGAKYDGVFGMWYGKGPGVDRSGDIFKHANLAGVGPHGGVLALAGDDPHAKSSTIPSASEPTFYDAQFPIIYPGSLQEVLDLGLHGYALSRYSGLWVGVKCVTNVCDEAATVEVSPDRVRPVLPDFRPGGEPFVAQVDPRLMTPHSLDLERTRETRLVAARLYAAVNRLNRIVVRGEHDRIGIVAAGKTWYDVRQALRDLGLDDAALREAGIRLLKIGMLYPLEREVVKEFARGLREIVVVEEKRPFLELFIRDILYHTADRPNVVGKADEEGRPLVPAYGELEPEFVTRLLARRLAGLALPESARARIATLEAIERRAVPLTVARTPYFCSGCPHNTSTQVPEGSTAGGGIGCHTMAMFLPSRHTVGVTPMGGEGVQWVGMAPFTTMPHMFQNLGDGTLFHSGYLAIKQAVASGANITYKILYNGAVAMTGGQQAAGQVSIPALTRQLEAEGVTAIALVSDDPEKWKSAPLAKLTTVHHRDELLEVQARLRDTPGTTVLVYDQQCAAEKRRLRKRGKQAEPAMRVFINEAVCEGCGDCGVKSNCLSVQPVDTEFGRKTRIHQSSCNKDYSCLKGDCPSFLTVEPAGAPAPLPAAKPKRPIPKVEVPLPEPAYRAPFREGYAIYMMGIGGTGVVTVNGLLGTAALLDGRRVRGLDQTGLSQKGGPVVSSLKIFDRESPDVANRVGAGEADLYLGFDLLGAANPKNLERAHPDRTSAVVSVSRVATGEMVANAATHFPDPFVLTRTIERHTREGRNVYLDAEAIAEGLFADHMASNLVTLGAAYQAGYIPISAESIERAIELNGVAVEMNRQAFRWGRRYVADRAAVDAALRAASGQPAPEVASRGNGHAASPADRLSTRERAAADRLLAASGATGDLLRLLETRVPELIAYQNVRYAERYVDAVARVAREEQALRPGSTALAEAFARNLFKLMAYKDEYEVARLLLRDEPTAEIRRYFPEGARVSYNLHPPLLRAMGLRRKLRLGPWFRPALAMLRGLKGLRGTPLDPFGRAEVRRVERALPAEYRGLVDRALAARDYDTAVALAELPDMVRGYEEIKLRSVAAFRAKAAELVARLDAGTPSTPTPPPVGAAAG
ncbi:MAG TPA: indolepyruvate ferredoxin oxidoreductase family protein, partial [Thermodesulfobacteriota bacterium]